jgi:hypothetical protein
MSYKTVTKDLNDFGFRERGIASKILSTLNTKKDFTKSLGKLGLEICFNMESGFVFISDQDYNVAIMNDDNLEDFLTCYECGYENPRSEYKEDIKEDGCNCCLEAL